jgi:hypothetical protein
VTCTYWLVKITTFRASKQWLAHIDSLK